jgi:molybdenum cofactor cytidylyltransferase
MDQSPRKDPVVSVIILAAGDATRMQGVDKLLETIDGVPLLSLVADACLSSAAAQVIAVIREGDTDRRAVLPDQIEIVINRNWGAGMASSLLAGLQVVQQNAQAILVVLADMPGVSSKDINALIAAFNPKAGISICQATINAGKPGHPVLFGRTHFAELQALTGDKGARAVINANPDALKYVKTSGENALIDLDTPEDWIAYRDR